MGGYESMVELIGIIATLFILLAFSLNDKKLIRLVDSIGALLFVIYGILINSLSVWLLNICLIIINLYKIKKNR